MGLSADWPNPPKSANSAEKFPDRFFNVGIAEQNLFGVAAGMAKSGLMPFVSTMAAFTSMRAAEQVRTDICYQNLNLQNHRHPRRAPPSAPAGTTHHCTEDLAIMRAFANMTVIAPADGIETANAVRACVNYPGPVYIRIGRGFEPRCYEDEDYGFQIGKAVNFIRERTSP